MAFAAALRYYATRHAYASDAARVLYIFTFFIFYFSRWRSLQRDAPDCALLSYADAMPPPLYMDDYAMIRAAARPRCRRRAAADFHGALRRALCQMSAQAACRAATRKSAARVHFYERRT